MQRQKESYDDDDQQACALLVSLDVLEECEYHPGTYFDGSTSLEDGYRIANAQWSAGTTHGFKSRRHMTDAMKAAAENWVSAECVSCEKWKDD